MPNKEVKFIVSTAAQNNFGRLIDDVATTGTRYIIRRHGKPKAAVIPIEELERLLLSERGGDRIAKVLRESRAEYGLGEKVRVA